MLGGIELVPSVFLAAFASYTLHGSSLTIATAIALANALQAAVGAYVLKLCRFDPLLRRMRDIAALGFVALTASAIVPTLVMGTYYLQATYAGGRTPSFSWTSYWGGDIWALLIIAPLIIRWLAKPLYRRTPSQHFETILVFVVLVVCNYVVFWRVIPAISGVSVIFVLFAPFFWIALRFSSRFVTLALALTSLMAYIATRVVEPAATAVTQTLGERLFQVELFIIFMAVIFYILESIANERRYAIEALKVQVRQLESALRRISSEDLAKTEFISVLAHELRNPLAPIMSGLELLQIKGTSAVESHGIVQMMTERVAAIRRLLDDLLDVARISQKKLVLKKELVDLRGVIERSYASINELTIQKTHRSELTLPADPVYIEGDLVRLEQIFVNVMKNAVKYTQLGGTVAIAVGQSGNVATVSVKDNGIGIESDMLEKIFEPFVQAYSTKVEHGGSGLGIGLSLTKRLVEIHGGTITARSAGPGKGSEFIISLPALHIVSQMRQEPNSVQASTSKKRPAKVLVVDDNVPAAEGIERLLSHTGYTTDTAFNGVDAIARVKTFKPDVILLDIGLPDMSGYEVARTLRSADNYSGRLVALTGFGQSEDKSRAFDAGFDGHLVKPVSIKDIEAAIAL